MAALAYSLVMGVLGVLNIAVAGIFVVGGYVGFAMIMAGQPLWLAFVVTVLVTALLGLLVERVAYHPLRHAPLIMPLLSTLGIAILLQTVVINTWGSDPYQLNVSPVSGSFEILGVSLTVVQLFIAVSAIVLFVALGALIRWTWMGRSIRAVADSPVVSSLLGVATARTTIMTFVISGVLAGIGGLMIGLNYSVLTPSSGLEIGLKGIAVMVIGGARNVWGGLLAGPLVGITEVLAIAYGASSWRDLVVWGMLVIVLLVRPQGLFSRASSLPERV
jgi:Branched-chain amino acid ABC-type transport system, permease components